MEGHFDISNRYLILIDAQFQNRTKNNIFIETNWRKLIRTDTDTEFTKYIKTLFKLIRINFYFIIGTRNYILYIYNGRKKRLIWTVESIWQRELLKNLTQLAINGDMKSTGRSSDTFRQGSVKRKYIYCRTIWVKIPPP